MKGHGSLIIALDIGTTALKVGLFSLNGELLKVATREQKLHFKSGGLVEQSPDGTWKRLASGIMEALEGHNKLAVCAIALSLQRGTVIPLDRDGTPLTDLIVWMDKRGLPLVDDLKEQVGMDRYYDISGHPITYITGVSKLLWLQRHAPEIWSRTAVIGPPETLFLKRLGCEDFVCADSTGTYLFPFDLQKKRWSDGLASLIGYPLDKLPRLVTSVDVVGRLSNAAARDFGLTPGIPLVPAGGDGQCAAVGAGVVTPGVCMINIGTATGVQTYLREPRRDPNRVLNCAAHVVPDAWEMEGHTQASGAVFRWLRDEFGDLEMALEKRCKLNAFDLLIDQAIQAPAGCEGLLFLPTFNGSTAPIIDESARGALLGLSLRHQRPHVLRAVLEGISLEIRWMLDAILQTGAQIDKIHLVGGGSSNRFWNQIHADIMERPVSTLHITDAALVGAAMCAAVAVGEYRDLHEAAGNFVRLKETIDPQKDTQAVYAAAYAKYRQVFRLLSQSGIYKNLIH